jgi:hypothetical protein
MTKFEDIRILFPEVTSTSFRSKNTIIENLIENHIDDEEFLTAFDAEKRVFWYNQQFLIFALEYYANEIR